VLDARLSSFACGPTEVEQHLSSSALDPLVTLVGRVVHEPLARGNQVELLVDGDQAFPAMLEAIEGAKQSVALSSYIFDNDDAGRRFAQALEAAHRRGVAVRVLIDDVGRRYSLPSISRRLTRAGVRVAHFLPSYLPLLPYMNLRNHGKVLVVDGHVAFTGGMNIRQGNLLATHPRHPIRDLQARIHGPVVGHLLHAFMHDWFFTTKEILEGDRWFPALEARGPVIARGVPDGPDENCA
jgi:cardiolipin synthase